MGADFEEVRMYSPSHAGGAGSAEEAVRGADVVVDRDQLARAGARAHEWLAPGAHVNAVGASMPRAREIEVETVAAAALFCDSRESLRNEAGRVPARDRAGRDPPARSTSAPSSARCSPGTRPGPRATMTS